MALSGRVKRDRLTNASFEALNIAIGSIQDQISQMGTEMSQMNLNGLGIPTPALPFKIAQRTEPEGVFVSVRVENISADLERLIIIVIRKNQNKIIGSEDDTSAKARINQRKQRFAFDITDIERSSGIFEGEIGPFPIRHERDSSEDEKDRNRFQLIKLVGEDISGDKVKNPDEDPLSDSATVPIEVLAVNTPGDDEFYFDINGDEARASKPSLDLLCNKVDQTTEAIDSKTTFTIKALSTNNGGSTDKSFEDRGYTDVYAVIKKKNDMAAEPIKIGGPLVDPTATQIDLEINLPLGKVYQWVRNILTNATSKETVTPDSTVEFTAGSNRNFDNFATDPMFWTTFTVVAEDPRHATLTLDVTQPVFMEDCQTGGYIYKAVRFEKQRANGTWKVLNRQRTLDDDGAFSSGANRVYTFEAQTRKDIASINFRAVLVAAGRDSNGDQPLRIVTQGGVFSTEFPAPADPILADIIENAPDDDTNEADTRTQIRVYADPTRSKTFLETGADSAFIRIRKQKASGGGSTDDPSEDNKLPLYGGPIDPADLGATFTIITIRGLRLGKRYVIKRALLQREGSTKKSNLVDIPFIAGAGNTNPLTLILEIPTIVRVDERHSTVECMFTQPNPPVLLKNIELHRKRPNDANFIEIIQWRLADDATFNSPGTYVVRFDVQHKKKTNGIQYFYRIRAIGNAFVTSPTRTDGDTGDGSPATIPSSPSLSSTYLLVNEPNTDTSGADARIIARIFADANNTSTVSGLTWSQVNVTQVTAVFRKNGETAVDPIKIVATPDPNATFTDIEVNLRLGKLFDWVRNISSNGDGQIRSTGGAVSFRAGSRTEDLSGISNSNFRIDTANVTIEDPRHSFIPVIFTQPTPSVFVRRLNLFGKQSTQPTYKLVAFEVLKEEDTFSTPGPKTVQLFVKHPQNKTMNYYPIITGASGASVGSPIHNQSTPYILNTGSDPAVPPPTLPPSSPSTSTTFLVINTIDTDATAGRARVVLRIFANAANQLDTFSNVGVTDMTCVVRRTGDTSDRIRQSSKVDSTATFIDFEFDLRLGKQYTWVKNISSNAGGQINSTGAAVNFQAGGLTESLGGITGFQINAAGVQSQDERHSLIPVIFTQSNPPATLKRMNLMGKKNTESTFKLVGFERLLDDDTFQSTGMKSVPFIVQHPKRSTLQYFAELVGAGGTKLTSGQFTLVTGDVDPGPPDWVPNTRVVRGRWNLKGLRVKSKPPTTNIETLFLTRIRFRFQATVSPFTNYYWDPNNPTTFQTFDSGNFDNDLIYIDNGLASSVFYNVDKTTYSAGIPTYNDIPVQIANDLNGNFGGVISDGTQTGFLEIIVYYFNRATPNFPGQSQFGVGFAPFSSSLILPWRRNQGIDNQVIVATG